MFTIIKTESFDRWLVGIRDPKTRGIILKRIDFLRIGHFGDFKSVACGILEARIFAGKGYRIYFTIRGNRVIILLMGGDKQTQQRDIEKAIMLAQDIE